MSSNGHGLFQLDKSDTQYRLLNKDHGVHYKSRNEIPPWEVQKSKVKSNRKKAA